MPQDDLVERVAEAEGGDWTVDPETGRSNSSAEYLRSVDEVARLIRGSGHSLINGHVRSVAALIVAQLAHVHGLAPAEPLTTTPEPLTTETEREAPINQDPPEGFEYEYRAGRTSLVAGEGEGEYESSWWPERDHGVVVQMVKQWRARDGRSWVDSRLERRLVGPPERMGDE